MIESANQQGRHANFAYRETAALENSSSYFLLLDRIADGAFTDLQTEQELYNGFIQVLKEDGHFHDAASLSSFKFALALRTAAPRIEAQYQYYRTTVEPSMMAAQDAACPVWVHLDGQQYCSPELERAQQPVDNDELEVELPFDRTLTTSSNQLISTLYADITHPLFGQFHRTVSKTAQDGKTAYRVRYRPSIQEGDRQLLVSGYGVELVLKRTDYIVIDDRDPSDSTSEKDIDPKDESADLRPLTTSELSHLGVNAAEYIMSSENPMTSLLEVTANFPKYSSKMVGRNTSDAFMKEHFYNRDILLPSGLNVLWMNGLQIQPRDINAYSLLDLLRKERRLIHQLQAIGLSATEAINLLSHEVIARAHADDSPQRYDWRAAEDEANTIIWLNDVEKDSRYANWPRALSQLLQRTYPGQLPQVARDIHNLVVPVDLNNIKDLDLIVNPLQTMIKRSFPIRIGLVPIDIGESSRIAAKMSYNILDTYGISTLMKFYQEIVTSKQGVSGIKTSFDVVTKDKEPKEDHPSLTYQELTADPSFQERLDRANNYCRRLSLSGKTLPVFINGVAIPRDESWFEAMSQRIYMDHRTLQVAVYERRIDEEIWVPEFLLEGAAAQRNPFIIPENTKDIYVANIAQLATDYASTFAALPRIKGDDTSALLSSRAHLLLVLDLDNAEGQALLSEALSFHELHPEVEILLMHNQKPGEPLSKFATDIYHLATSNTNYLARDVIQDALKASGGDVPPYSQDQEKAQEYWLLHDNLIEQLGLQSGENGLWLNGRLLRPISGSFLLSDFENLLAYENQERISPVTTAITALALEDKFTNPLDIAKVTSIVARSLKAEIPEGIYESAPLVRFDRFNDWKNESTMIHLKADGEPTVQIVSVIDPASEQAQSWVPILKVLSELQGVDVRIFLNPKEMLSELPVKRFYRNVISSAPEFDTNGTLVDPEATFSGIPQDTLFTLGMVVPPAWLVSPEESVYDLDNIKLSSVPAGQHVNALYELEYILIEGHSRDTTKGSPPRGAQLLLGTQQQPHFTDTIVMANLGYFQFKANPGHWNINLKPGRSSKIFTIDSVGSKGYAPQPGDEGNQVTLMSFQGVTLFPRLSRKPGMAEEDVLETGGIVDTAASYIKKGQSLLNSFGLGGSKSKDVDTTQADVNIFSVASGHLYERMLNIMMVSVMRHTTHTVKFWFIEQFLSPSFKRSLPHLALHYGFKYEMVMYKWPHWLRGQVEKQREIWGYKILFLDVLFPLDLDKVIFVDADQIVRTDMMELNRVDLHGAPYGFTPMCDSRTEMEGFRFWKQGYWEKFLEGKPYHISALYVVDLKRFRELAAGDRLRGQYHALSADPASLSNLDQDLPNHMQHNLPIHSLDQNWLWCETWCSDEALASAKTIDLCNNPLTKEPKLDRARRQVPEWTEYDNEIAGVLKDAMKDEDSEALDLKAGSERQNEEQSEKRDKKVKDEL